MTNFSMKITRLICNSSTGCILNVTFCCIVTREKAMSQQAYISDRYKQISLNTDILITSVIYELNIYVENENIFHIFLSISKLSLTMLQNVILKDKFIL
jgi:hypothetical protein